MILQTEQLRDLPYMSMMKDTLKILGKLPAYPNPSAVFNHLERREMKTEPNEKPLKKVCTICAKGSIVDLYATLVLAN